MEKENIIIVEPLSTGLNYIHDIRELGYNPIALEIYQPEEKKERLRALHDHAYAGLYKEPPEVLLADKDYEKTLEMVRKLKPLAIIPGVDEGIILATKLAHDLGLPGNNPKNLNKMIDKHCMQETLKKANLRYIKSRMINTLDEAMEFASELNKHYVVIKPAVGKASMGVCICKNEEEIEYAMKFNEDIKFDITSNEGMHLAIQEYIGGEEYVIDTACCKGHNRVVNAYHYKKFLAEGRGAVYDYMEAIDDSDPHFKELVEYNEKVITALELEYGVVHGEYKIDEYGPVLIEMNCRVAGPSQRYYLMDIAWGEHTTALSLESYLNPEECIKKVNKPIKIHSHYLIKVIILHEEIYAIKSNLDEGLKDLESYQYSIPWGDDRVYPITVDLDTCGGIVFLTNKDKDKLFEDLEEIKRREEFEIDKLFVIK